jgi:hypothetical protein
LAKKAGRRFKKFMTTGFLTSSVMEEVEVVETERRVERPVRV